MPPASAPPLRAPWHETPVAGKRASPVLPAWLVILHPNPEIAASRAVTARDTFPASTVSWSTRGSDILRADRPLPTGDGAVLVHIDGVDRFRAGWAGDRILSRFAVRGVPTVAWVGAGDRDGVALALQSGAAGVFAPCAHDAHGNDDHVPEMRAAIGGALRGDPVPALGTCPNRPRGANTEADLASWFEARYGALWQPWVEPAVAVIAGGGERTEQAEALRGSLVPPTSDHAMRRLRQITETLCGEIRGNETVLRREALVILRRVARVRPIAAEPLVIRSVQRAARLLATDPGLALEAGLQSAEVADLIEVALVECDAKLRPVRRRGRPEAGAWRLRRDLALGRVAERRGKTASEKLAALDGLRRSLASSLVAVYDALEDRERPSAH